MITSVFMSLLLDISYLKRISMYMNATFSRQRQSIQVRSYNAMFEYRSTGSRIMRVHFSDLRVMENRFDFMKMT